VHSRGAVQRGVIAEAAVRERGRALAALASVAAVLALARGSAAADVPRVGVVVATTVNVTEPDADQLAGRLGDALRAKLEVDVIAGVGARRRLPPEGVAVDCVARLACVRDVASRLDSDELLFLFVVRIGPRLQVDVTWSDPDIDQVVSRDAMVLPAVGGEEADSVLAAAPSRLLPHVAPREPVVRATAEPLVMTTEAPVRSGRRLTVPTVVTGVAAAAALATGVGFAVAARKDYDELEADGCHRMACSGIDGRIDKMERRALTADILFVTAGVAAATSVVLYVFSGDSEPRMEVGAAPTSGGAAVSFGGAF
jgi:hypothetical protein